MEPTSFFVKIIKGIVKENRYNNSERIFKGINMIDQYIDIMIRMLDDLNEAILTYDYERVSEILVYLTIANHLRIGDRN